MIDGIVGDFIFFFLFFFVLVSPSRRRDTPKSPEHFLTVNPLTGFLPL